MTLADEIRAETKRIIARNFGLPNELAAIRIATVEKIDAYVEDAQDKLSRCTCDHDSAFALDEWLFAPSRINPLAAAAAVNMRKEHNT
jgi:hypothetical protein